MSILDRLARRVLASDFAELQQQVEHTDRVFHEMVALRPMMMLDNLQQIANLAEVDSQYMELIRRLIAAGGLYGETTEQDRLLAVRESRVLQTSDPVTERIIDIWTDFGFGLKLDIEPVDDAAKEVWNEFWKAERNKPLLAERVIHELSDTLLGDGEFWFVYFVSEHDGQVTLRLLLTDEIKEIITDPDDDLLPVYYRRVWKDLQGNTHEMYYRDWRIRDDDGVLGKDLKLDSTVPKAEDKNGNTSVFAMHIAFRLRGIKKLRGWPLLTTGAPWARAYKEFLQNRAAIARAVASVVDKLIVKGGSTAVDVIRARFDAALDDTGRWGVSDVPEAGSTWVENEALTRQRMPLTTGAGDARIDGGALLAQAGLPGGIPPHALGRGEVVRMAVAEAMDAPIYRQFQRYQNLWVSVWQDVATVVLTMQERYVDASYGTKDVTVQTDALLNVGLPDIVALGTLIEKGVLVGSMDIELAERVSVELLRLGLHILGVQDASDIIEPKGEEKEEVSKERPVEEIHQAKTINEKCPFCGHVGALVYEDHGEVRVCAGCEKAWTPGESQTQAV